MRQMNAGFPEPFEQLVDREAEADHRERGARPCHQGAIGGHQRARRREIGSLFGELVCRARFHVSHTHLRMDCHKRIKALACVNVNLDHATHDCEQRGFDTYVPVSIDAALRRAL